LFLSTHTASPDTCTVPAWLAEGRASTRTSSARSHSSRFPNFARTKEPGAGASAGESARLTATGLPGGAGCPLPHAESGAMKASADLPRPSKVTTCARPALTMGASPGTRNHLTSRPSTRTAARPGVSPAPAGVTDLTVTNGT
jgi:hypothetical protein